MTRWPWQRHRDYDVKLTPDPEAVEALRVQRIKRRGADARRKQAEPIVKASDEAWGRNHLAEAIMAAAKQIAEGGR